MALVRTGEIIADRFTIEREIAVGGMSRIYRARDAHTGTVVAVKITTSDDPRSMTRFLREARVLADIHHPGIVRYVGHGRLQAGQAYLAMEWLEGEDLSHYLRQRTIAPDAGTSPREVAHGSEDGTTAAILPAVARAPGAPDRIAARFTAETETLADLDDIEPVPAVTIEPLAVADTVRLGRRVASAVAELHRRGIVHRDIKPSNLFLPHRQLDQVKLLDLGTARRHQDVQRLTRPGHIVGTPQYMAPEQVRSGGAISPRVDVWAIGCVLYQCITGHRLFTGSNLIAVLTSIVLDEPTPIDELRAGVPPQLNALIMSMLDKDPARRPPDAGNLAQALEPLERPLAAARLHRAPAGEGSSATHGLTGEEARVRCLLFASVPDDHERRDAIATSARALGGQARQLANGALLVTMPGVQEPTEQATRIAHTALALHDGSPELAMVIATGRAEGFAPMGALACRAAAMQARAEPGVIRLDERTASLLASRFHISHDRNVAYLGRMRDHEATPTLFGKPTLWVGRRRELTTLLATLDECEDSQVARAVLLTGPAGMGKSRLGREFTRALHRRGGDVEVIYGRGDVIGAGSPFMLLAPALRDAAGIVGDEPVEVRRRKLHARLARAVAPGDCDRIAPFIGELAGVPFPDRDNQALRAARRDPLFRAQLMTAAWEEWLSSECAHHPVLFVLEDLHWADAPSIQLIDATLSALSNRPIMVLALARPEVHEAFPQLWCKRALQEMPLHPLSARDSANLVRSALDGAVADALVDTIVAHAEGNAFFLEEIIRAVARGCDRSLPSTVLGVVQARLDGLGAEAKRVLRAASVFGETFWSDGLVALLQGSGVFEVSEWLADLVAGELIKPQPLSRFAGQIEYRFSHSLLREGAYALLTSGDRRLGHALAAAWLEAAGEPDHVVSAEHYVRGGRPREAIPHYQRAATQALESNHLAAALDHAERAVAAGADDRVVGELRALQSTAAFWLARYRDAVAYAGAATERLPPGSGPWYVAMANQTFVEFRLGDRERGLELLAQVSDSAGEPEALAEKIICLCRGAFQLLLDGYVARANPFIVQIAEAMADGSTSFDSRSSAQLCSALALRAQLAHDWNNALDYRRRALALFEDAGDVRNIWAEQIAASVFWGNLGRYQRAIELTRRILDNVRKQKIATTITMAKCQLGYFLLQLHRGAEETQPMLVEALAECRAAGNLRLEGFVLGQLTRVALRAGRHDEAEALAVEACDKLAGAPAFLHSVLAHRARLLLRRGRGAEAEALARRAAALLDELGGSLLDEYLTPLVLAETLDAQGQRASARAVIADAATSLRRAAQRLDDPELRESYFGIPSHRKILALERQWTELADAG